MTIEERAERLADQIDGVVAEDVMAAILAALRAVRDEAVEEAAKAAEGELVDYQATKEPTDRAYNIACWHCAAAIRALATTGGSK